MLHGLLVHMYICTPCVCHVLDRDYKIVSDSPELELQRIISNYVDVEIKSMLSRRAASPLNCLATSLTLQKLINLTIRQYKEIH